MPTNLNQEKPNPFDNIPLRRLVPSRIYIPAERAARQVVSQIYGRFKGNAAKYGLSEADLDVLRRAARAAAIEERDKVRALSKTTLAHKVDDVLEGIEWSLAISARPVEQRRTLVGSIHSVRMGIRNEIDQQRRKGMESSRLGNFREEAYLDEQTRYSSHDKGYVEIPTNVSGLVAESLEVGGYKNLDEMKKDKKLWWISPNDAYSWIGNVKCNIPGVSFIVSKWTGKGNFQEGVTLTLRYSPEQYKQNYRLFDTAKPANFPPL